MNLEETINHLQSKFAICLHRLIIVGWSIDYILHDIKVVLVCDSNEQTTWGSRGLREPNLWLERMHPKKRNGDECCEDNSWMIHHFEGTWMIQGNHDTHDPLLLLWHSTIQGVVLNITLMQTCGCHSQREAAKNPILFILKCFNKFIFLSSLTRASAMCSSTNLMLFSSNKEHRSVWWFLRFKFVWSQNGRVVPAMEVVQYHDDTRKLRQQAAMWGHTLEKLD